jgi:hypothetical protein
MARRVLHQEGEKQALGVVHPEMGTRAAHQEGIHPGVDPGREVRDAAEDQEATPRAAKLSCRVRIGLHAVHPPHVRASPVQTGLIHHMELAEGGVPDLLLAARAGQRRKSSFPL